MCTDSQKEGYVSASEIVSPSQSQHGREAAESGGGMGRPAPFDALWSRGRSSHA